MGIVTYDPRRCKFSQNIRRFPMSNWRHFIRLVKYREKPRKKQILYTEILCNNTGVSLGLINEGL